MVRRIGRYEVHGEFAAGGMASVHLGRLIGATGFSRTVAIKILHPQFAKVSEVSAMLVDEAHLASRIRHVNVVSPLDVVTQDGELFLVMDYVHGASLAAILAAERERGQLTPCDVACAIARDVLRGLHAAHEATSERGEHLEIVHRDVSPQNVVVGVDGVARVLDFGIAKAAMRAQSTDGMTLKGKLSYMAPEQLLTGPVDARTDVFATAVVLWEMLAGARCFHGDDIVGQRVASLNEPVPSLYDFRDDVPRALEEIVAKGLARDPPHRFPSAAAMADAIEAVVRPSPTAEVRVWMDRLALPALAERARLLAEMETGGSEVLSPHVRGATTGPGRDDDATVTTYAGAISPRLDEARKHSRWLPALAGVSLALITALIVVVWRMAQHEPAKSAAPVVEDLPSTSDVQAPAEPEVASAPVGSEPSTLRAPARGPARTAAPRRAPAQRPKPKAQKDCDPPFEFRDGVKQFKSECI